MPKAETEMCEHRDSLFSAQGIQLKLWIATDPNPKCVCLSNASYTLRLKKNQTKSVLGVREGIYHGTFI